MGLHMQGDTGFLRRLLEARETNHPKPSGNHDRDVLDVALHKLHDFLFRQISHWVLQCLWYFDELGATFIAATGGILQKSITQLTLNPNP